MHCSIKGLQGHKKDASEETVLSKTFPCVYENRAHCVERAVPDG